MKKASKAMTYTRNWIYVDGEYLCAECRLRIDNPDCEHQEPEMLDPENAEYNAAWENDQDDPREI